MKRVLLTWIGYNDLRSLAATLSETQRKEVLREVGGGVPQPGDEGPIKALVGEVAFDEIRLLNNYSSQRGRQFARWVGPAAQAVDVRLRNPSDYKAIYKIVDAELDRLSQRKDWGEIELCIHLSPGTPAMAAIWVLLGKSKYPATFYQTYQGQAWVTEIPFNLTVDYLPELYRRSDARLEKQSASPSELAGFQHIIGDSPIMKKAVDLAHRAAMRNLSTLLLGESGSGKELFARAIHDTSARRDQPFVAMNCAAISRELLESELFGHEKGAFTGAHSARPGAFELANGGTLFLDEVGECDLSLQTKLLRVLQPPHDGGLCERVFRRVGGTRDLTSNVRVIAATNRDLMAAIGEGRFREDLYYRLAVVTIKVPALRDRRSDIPALAAALLERANAQFRADEPGYQDKPLSDAARAFIKTYPWPGNVRQLYNALLQATGMCSGKVISREDIAAAVADVDFSAHRPAEAWEQPLGDGFSLQDAMDALQRHLLRSAMEQAHGVKAEAARLLGIDHYQTLDAKLKRLRVGGNWK
jgi:transcriptional regulator with PAS, ATPase and Fis domain